jgi:uncharacterized membrane-anchored protein
MRRLIIGALLSLAASAAFAITNEERRDEIAKLNWERGGVHKLAASRSTLSIPSDHAIAIGPEADRFEALIGNRNLKGVEAVTLNQASEQVIFQTIDEGYVSIDDWRDIDAKAMLDSISENTEKANEERAHDGFPPMHIVGWIQQPALDPTTNTVYWAIAVTEGNSSVVNSRALRLGRHGFELLTWIGDGKAYQPIGGDLDVMLRSFSFDSGARYTDFTPGDKVAAYTIAGLVATLAGAKLIKVAAAGGLLLLLKKFGVVIVAAIVGLLAKFRGRFMRKKAASTAPQ